MARVKLYSTLLNLYTVAIYDKDWNIVKCLRTAHSHEKADYYCRYYSARIKLAEGQSIMYF